MFSFLFFSFLFFYFLFSFPSLPFAQSRMHVVAGLSFGPLATPALERLKFEGRKKGERREAGGERHGPGLGPWTLPLAVEY